MRLGAQPCQLTVGSRAGKLYGSFVINERHRHRFEFNNIYREKFERRASSSAACPGRQARGSDRTASHPFYLASQFHPEFLSKPHQPHPLFKGFIAAAHQFIHKKPL